MTKIHCDRCDATLTGTQNIPKTWTQELETEESPVYHLRVINGHGTGYELCKMCLADILERFLKELQL